VRNRGLRRLMWVLEVLAWVVWVRIAVEGSCLSRASLLLLLRLLFFCFPLIVSPHIRFLLAVCCSLFSSSLFSYQGQSGRSNHGVFVFSTFLHQT
jgi:hypothetical protein